MVGLNDMQFYLEVKSGDGDVIIGPVAIISNIEVTRDRSVLLRRESRHGTIRLNLFGPQEQMEHLIEMASREMLYNPRRVDLFIYQHRNAESYNKFIQCFMRSIDVVDIDSGIGWSVVETDWVFHDSETNLFLPVELRPEQDLFDHYDLWHNNWWVNLEEEPRDTEASVSLDWRVEGF